MTGNILFLEVLLANQERVDTQILQSCSTSLFQMFMGVFQLYFGLPVLYAKGLPKF
jgi:hypothetical protein